VALVVVLQAQATPKDLENKSSHGLFDRRSSMCDVLRQRKWLRLWQWLRKRLGVR